MLSEKEFEQECVAIEEKFKNEYERCEKKLEKYIDCDDRQKVEKLRLKIAFTQDELEIWKQACQTPLNQQPVKRIYYTIPLIQYRYSLLGIKIFDYLQYNKKRIQIFDFIILKKPIKKEESQEITICL